jgi:excisionase family DNA binding protein
MTERVTMAEAARRMGVSNQKIWRMVREGLLHVERNPLDGRERLVRTADLEKFTSQSQGEPHFVSDGIVNVPTAPRAAYIEEYLRAHWRL